MHCGIKEGFLRDTANLFSPSPKCWGRPQEIRSLGDSLLNHVEAPVLSRHVGVLQILKFRLLVAVTS